MVVGQVADGRDLVVVGGGPGGYEVALRAAGLGRRVTLVDRAGPSGLGGECLHNGCIPSKMLIEYAGDRDAKDGHRAEGRLGDFQAEKARAIEGLRAGIERATARAGVEVIAGIGRFLSGQRLVIEKDEGPPRFLEYDTAVLATGSAPLPVSGLAFDGSRVLDAAALLRLTDLPDDVAVIGGGYIGVELGTALAKLGVTVTIVELRDRILSELDADLARVVSARLARLGVTVVTGSIATGSTGAGVVIRDLASERDRVIEAPLILAAIGRRPNTAGLGVELAGAELGSSGQVTVDATCRAGQSLYAIGDVARGPALAHKATAQARMVAELTAGRGGHRDIGEIPLVVFADPEVASIGATARDVLAAGGELISGVVPLAAVGRASTMRGATGFARVVADRASGAVVGFQMAGPHASELVACAAIAIELGAVLEDIDGIVFAHPTLAEIVAAAARAAQEVR